MVVTKFQSRHATLAYATGALTWDATTLIDGETMTPIVEIKDVTVTTPEHGVETLPCLGNTAQTIGANTRTAGTATGIIGATFQNKALVATSLGNWKFEGTLVCIGDEQFQHILGLDSGTAITGGTRYAVGNIHTSFYWAKNMLGSMRIYLNNGSEKMSVGMSNTWVTKIGDIKPTGADGHFEVDFSVECMPKDGAIEWLT